MQETGGNREHILGTGLRLFAERGYEAVGVGEICGFSGITKPTLYHYFGSKRGLLDAIVAERGGPLLASVKEAARYDHDVRLGLERLAFAFARAAQADGDFARLRLAMSFAPPASEPGAAAAAFNQALFLAVEEFFRQAALDHGNMKGRSRAFAGTFIGTLDSYTGFWLAGLGLLDEATLRHALRQFMYGIFS
jgi:TetR/AcrR family transcriptional regulator